MSRRGLVRAVLVRAVLVRAVLPLLALVSGIVATGPAVSAAPAAPAGVRPVIFVHGGAGSGSQFETQALRFASNGYPIGHLDVHEYDSTFANNTMAQVWAGLDALIAHHLRKMRADRVDLLGHSLGTFVVQGYLNSSPERAARVAHYVNLDGATAGAPPGGVETLAVWGEGNPARQIVGATNYYAPNQSHTQVVTSPETFVEIFEFFTGREPTTTDVVPEPPGQVSLAGEANLFPVNLGADGTRVEIWEVDGGTGHRIGAHPRATFDVAPDGKWGPFRANGKKHYEFAVVWAADQVHHFYYQPFLRSDHLIRLLTSEPGTGLGALIERSDNHSALVISRNKEWWGNQGAENDVLEINGANILNAANSPRTKRVIGIFAFDAGVDGVTDLSAPLAPFFAQPFLTGMDVFIPATPAATGTVGVTMTARHGDGDIETVNLPDWASTNHRSTIQFRDFSQAVDRFPGYR
jgi:pimeloyl-ACP methyl ester carboxylesterase